MESGRRVGDPNWFFFLLLEIVHFMIFKLQI